MLLFFGFAPVPAAIEVEMLYHSSTHASNHTHIHGGLPFLHLSFVLRM